MSNKTPDFCSQWPYLFSLQSLRLFVLFWDDCGICQTRLSERSKSLFFVLRGTLFVICISPVIHLVPPPPHPPPNFAYSRPKRNWKQCLCKILGGKQYVFCEICKCQIPIWCDGSPVCSTCSFRFLARKLEDFRIGTVGFYQYVQMRDCWRQPCH